MPPDFNSSYKIVARRGQVRDRLRKLAHRHARAARRWAYACHLIRVVMDAANSKSLAHLADGASTVSSKSSGRSMRVGISGG